MRDEQEIMLWNKYKGMLSWHVIQTKTYRVVIIFSLNKLQFFLHKI